MNRSIQEIESEMCVPLGVVTENATCSAPWSARIAPMRSRDLVSASSQPIGCQPGSAAPFGCVRRIGCRMRSG